MGLSASQARLLNLTARMHDIEYRAQNLEAQKLQMANESKQVYQEYENALNQQKVQYKVISASGEVKFENFNQAALGTGDGKSGYSLRRLDGGSIPTTFTAAQLSDMLASGLYILTKDGTDVNIATETALQEVNDESELKKAEAKYEAAMRQINAKDKKFDTDLAALEAERNAIKTEMDTLKSVAKENVDRTYKLFS